MSICTSDKVLPKLPFSSTRLKFCFGRGHARLCQVRCQGGSFFWGFPIQGHLFDPKNMIILLLTLNNKNTPFLSKKWLSSQQQMTVFAKSTKVLEVQHFQAGQGMEERPLALGTLGFWTFFLGGFEKRKSSSRKKRVVSLLWRDFGCVFSFFWLNRWSYSKWNPGKALRPKVISRLSNHVTPSKVGPYYLSMEF